MKKKKPKFIRQDAHKKGRLAKKWRKPKGLQSKMRLCKKGYRKRISKGYKSPKEVPKDRFRIVVGRNAYITQGSSTNNPLLAELVPENTLWLHPIPAKRLGINPGDTVEVKIKPIGTLRNFVIANDDKPS